MNPLKSFLAAAAVTLWGTVTVATPAVDCRVGDGLGPNSSVIIVAVDRTAVRNAVFNAGVEAAISAAIRPNSRLVLWTFGGHAHPLPQLVLDVVTPALPETHVVDINVIAQRMMNTAGHAERVRDCVLARVDEQRRAFLAALHAELDTFDPSPNGASPILLTLGQAVHAFSDEAARGLVDVIVVTDGYEYSTEASFYPINGRYLRTEEALAKTQSVVATLRGARVSMVGVGVVSNSVGTAGVSALVEIWQAILLQRGAIPIQLTTGSPQRLRR